MVDVVQAYQQTARAAEIQASSTDDPHLRFVWEQIAISYEHLAEKRLKVLAAEGRGLDDGLAAGVDDALRSCVITTAIACREQAERMHTSGLAEKDEGRQRVMLAISRHYHLLHDDLLALDQLMYSRDRHPH